VGEPQKPRVEVPTSCPFCQSANLKTTSKTIDESTYWRCLGCGEIWNHARQSRRAPSFFRRN
jgi:transposase-like protein